MNPIDESDLDALLHAPLDELPDNGFADAVMRRVAAEAVRQHPALDAAAALERLRARAASERRAARWSRFGLCAGAALAALAWWALGAAGAEITAPQSLALVTGLVLAAWLLVAQPAAAAPQR